MYELVTISNNTSHTDKYLSTWHVCISYYIKQHFRHRQIYVDEIYELVTISSNKSHTDWYLSKWHVWISYYFKQYFSHRLILNKHIICMN